MKFTFSPESRVLDGYTIKRAIYRGGFGEVYYALSDAGREVALKLLQNNSEIELRGVQQCLNLSHPNLVTIFDVRQDEDGDHWIIMEYVAGETLDAAIRCHPNGLPMEAVRRWLSGVCDGVSYLHSRGLVHRDLKPGNLFSDDGIVKVGDVGLSKFITPSRRSAQTQSVGTVYYMAPEVAQGRYGKEVDIYALGIIVFEMLTGHVPFDGESTGEILMKHLSEKPDVSQLPPRLRPVIAKALEKDPHKRYPTIQAFREDFDTAVLGKSIVLDIPTENFTGPAEPVTQDAHAGEGNPEETTSAPETKLSLLERAMPSSAGWWFITATATLIALLWNKNHHSSHETLVTFLASGSVTFFCYSVLRWSGYLFRFDRQAAGPPLSADRYLIPGWEGSLAIVGVSLLGIWSGFDLPRAIIVAYSTYLLGRLLFYSIPAVASPPSVVHRKRRGHLLSFRNRTEQWFIGAALSALMTGLILGAIGLIAPSMFSLTSESRVDPAVMTLFGSTTLIAAWMIQLVSKILEPAWWDNTVRRFALLGGGVLTGLSAWAVGDYLLLDLPALYASQNVHALFDTLGERPLIAGQTPTLLGYITFFAGLFSLRAWWRLTRLGRRTRFGIGSVLMTIIVAWIWSAVMAFPQTWALLWAASISAVVQLSSPWSQSLSRSRQPLSSGG